MNKEHLREMIQFVLKNYNLYSRDAEELLMLTAACESNLGHYFKQLNGGPALGIFQCEPDTYGWMTMRLENKRHISNGGLSLAWCSLLSSINTPLSARHFMCDLEAQILSARLIYWFKTPKAIPPYDDIELLARYWKRYWNSELGAGTIEGAIEKYNKYVK